MTTTSRPAGERRAHRRRRRWLILLALVLLVGVALYSVRPRPGHELKGTARAPDGRSVITSWLPGADPAAWDPVNNRIIFNRRDAQGLWMVYSSLPDGSDVRCISCRLPSLPGAGAATNRGAFDVSPDGRYVLETVEKGSHPGAIGASITTPGVGVFNDIWLETIDGTRAWRLTNLPVSNQDGIIWPRFDRTGHQIVWAQMHKGSDLTHPLGQWTLELARLRWLDGTPHLVDIRTYDPQPGRFFEPYGFSPDDQRILFCSDIDVPSHFLSPTAFNAQIWTINAAHLDDLQRVSPPDRIGGMFSDYNEFASYIPGTDRIVISRTYQSSAHGLDYWTVNANGTDPRRLTFLNQPGNPQYLGYSNLTAIAFDPRDPRRFVAAVTHSLSMGTVQGVFVTIGASALG